MAVGDLIVTTTADTVDAPDTSSVTALITNNGPDGRISLREAILATNATAGAADGPLRDPAHGPQPLLLPGRLRGRPLDRRRHPPRRRPTSPTSIPTTRPASRGAGTASGPSRSLPDVTGPLVIDAETQPGFIVGGPVVELDGSVAGGGITGLSLMQGPGSVRGLVINRFGNDGLALRGAVSGYTITGNYIGTDVSGTLAAGNGGRRSLHRGDRRARRAPSGVTRRRERNIISGNGVRGVLPVGLRRAGHHLADPDPGQLHRHGRYGNGGAGGPGPRNDPGVHRGARRSAAAARAKGNLISGNNGFGIELNGNRERLRDGSRQQPDRGEPDRHECRRHGRGPERRARHHHVRDPGRLVRERQHHPGQRDRRLRRHAATASTPSATPTTTSTKATSSARTAGARSTSATRAVASRSKLPGPSSPPATPSGAT